MDDHLIAGTPYQDDLQTIIRWIDEADALVIGGASGMSTACGYDYYTHHTPFFERYFSDFGKIYHEPSCWQLLYHSYSSTCSTYRLLSPSQTAAPRWDASAFQSSRDTTGAVRL